MRGLIAPVLAAFFVAACASGDTATQESQAAETPEPPSAPVPEALKNVPRSALGPQRLAPSECGLFLWSKTDPTQFIFFERAASGQALVQVGEDQLWAPQTGAGGEIFGQFTTQQRFETADGRSLALQVTPGEELTGGQRISAGQLTVTDAGGWRTVIPVLGVRACQPG